MGTRLFVGIETRFVFLDGHAGSVRTAPCIRGDADDDKHGWISYKLRTVIGKEREQHRHNTYTPTHTFRGPHAHTHKHNGEEREGWRVMDRGGHEERDRDRDRGRGTAKSTRTYFVAAKTERIICPTVREAERARGREREGERDEREGERERERPSLRLLFCLVDGHHFCSFVTTAFLSSFLPFSFLFSLLVSSLSSTLSVSLSPLPSENSLSIHLHHLSFCSFHPHHTFLPFLNQPPISPPSVLFAFAQTATKRE